MKLIDNRRRMGFMGLALGAGLLAAGAGRAGAADNNAMGMGNGENTPSETSAAGTAAAAGDAQVLAKLHQVNQMEIEAGKLAQDKGQSRQAKSFGQTLVRDHQAADKKIMAYAKQAGVDIDSHQMAAGASDPSSDKHDQMAMDRLRQLSGAEFDREFANMMVEGHQKTIDMVTTAHGTATDPRLRTLLGQLLPTLKQHEKTAQALKASLQGRATGDTGTTPDTAQGRRPAKH
jgi:putative membrane protein